MVKVEVKQGWLEGEELPFVTDDGKYFSFKGIPYATPPLGDLRFKAPIAATPWEGVRKALKHGPVCHQHDIFTEEINSGSEDCLYLNVYTPDLKPTKLAPVMVWIHGGGFKSGSGDSGFYSPDFLVKQGVVLVTINYRLEVLGFLCLDTEEVPGNAGMKDQVEGLRWVRDNISSFGGDPTNVTIFGESAGGASVGYHIISPMSAGLFHRAILMSGSPLCEWASNVEAKKRALILAKQLGADEQILADPQRLLTFMQAVPLDSLIGVNGAIFLRESYAQPIHNFAFSPVMEKKLGHKAFFTESIINSLKKGLINDVDVMLGYVNEECIIMIPYLLKNLDEIDRHLELFLPNDLADKVSPSVALQIGDEIRKRYLGQKAANLQTLPELVKHSSARLIKYGELKFFEYLSTTKSPKYLYRFSCESERNVNTEYFKKGQKVDGVAHLDDLMYIFHQPSHNLPIDKNSKSYKMIQQTTALWTNFAKYGNPTPDNSLGVKWTPYTKEQPNYLEINEQLSLGTNLDREEFEFWDQIYSRVA